MEGWRSRDGRSRVRVEVKGGILREERGSEWMGSKGKWQERKSGAVSGKIVREFVHVFNIRK